MDRCQVLMQHCKFIANSQTSVKHCTSIPNQNRPGPMLVQTFRISVQGANQRCTSEHSLFVMVYSAMVPHFLLSSAFQALPLHALHLIFGDLTPYPSSRSCQIRPCCNILQEASKHQLSDLPSLHKFTGTSAVPFKILVGPHNISHAAHIYHKQLPQHPSYLSLYVRASI